MELYRCENSGYNQNPKWITCYGMQSRSTHTRCVAKIICNRVAKKKNFPWIQNRYTNNDSISTDAFQNQIPLVDIVKKALLLRNWSLSNPLPIYPSAWFVFAVVSFRLRKSHRFIYQDHNTVITQAGAQPFRGLSHNFLTSQTSYSPRAFPVRLTNTTMYYCLTTTGKYCEIIRHVFSSSIWYDFNPATSYL